MTSVAYFFGGPKDGFKAAREDAPFEINFLVLPPLSSLSDVPDSTVVRYRRRGPVREGVAYYDFVAEAPAYEH